MITPIKICGKCKSKYKFSGFEINYKAIVKKEKK